MFVNVSRDQNVTATFSFKSNQTFVDLEVADIVFSPDDKPKLGDTRSLKAIVKNNENFGFSYSFNYNIYTPSGPAGGSGGCCPYIGPNETREHSIGTINFNLVGKYTIEFSSYPDNYADSRPTNNFRSEYILIGNQTNQTYVDLAVGPITIFPPNPVAGLVYFNYTISNKGTIATNATSFTYIYGPFNSKFSRAKYCIKIDPGETKYYWDNFSAYVGGGWNISIGVVVEKGYPCYSEEIETNMTNNNQTIKFYVLNTTYLCGDVNGDKRNSLTDVISLINYLFKNGPAPSPLLAGDANGDKILNLADVTYLVNYLFKRGPKPSCGGEPNCYCT